MRISGEWELNPDELAIIFGFKDWRYATPSLGYGVPNAERIEELFIELRREVEDLEEVLNHDGSVLVGRGRFLAVKEPGIGAVDLYLNVGYMNAEDEPEIGVGDLYG